MDGPQVPRLGKTKDQRYADSYARWQEETERRAARGLPPKRAAPMPPGAPRAKSMRPRRAAAQVPTYLQRPRTDTQRERARVKAEERKRRRDAGELPRKRVKGKQVPFKSLSKANVAAIERTAAARARKALSREAELNKRWRSLQQAWTRFSLAQGRGDMRGAEKWNAVYSQRASAYAAILHERQDIVTTGTTRKRRPVPMISPPSGPRPRTEGSQAQRRWDKKMAEFMAAAEAYQANSVYSAPPPTAEYMRYTSSLSSAAAAPPPVPEPMSAAAAAAPPTPYEAAGSPYPSSSSSRSRGEEFTGAEPSSGFFGLGSKRRAVQ